MSPSNGGRYRGRMNEFRTGSSSTAILLALLAATPSAAETAQPSQSTELPRVVVTAPPPSGRSGARRQRAPAPAPATQPAAPAAPAAPSQEKTPLNSDAV